MAGNYRGKWDAGRRPLWSFVLQEREGGLRSCPLSLRAPREGQRGLLGSAGPGAPGYLFSVVSKATRKMAGSHFSSNQSLHLPVELLTGKQQRAFGFRARMDVMFHPPGPSVLSLGPRRRERPEDMKKLLWYRTCLGVKICKMKFLNPLRYIIPAPCWRNNRQISNKKTLLRREEAENLLCMMSRGARLNRSNLPKSKVGITWPEALAWERFFARHSSRFTTEKENTAVYFQPT